MAKTASRAAKPAAKPTATRAAPSRAAQAAQHQGRPAPKEDLPKPAQRASVPAVAKPAAPPVDPATVAHLPAFMQQDANMGTQGISREDVETPRIKLMQGLSKELQEYNDLRAGNFFHPSSEMIFDEPFRAVVIYTDRRYLLWRPLEDGGGILARADDAIHWSPSSGQFKVTLDKKDGGAEVVWKLAPTVQQSGLANWGTMNPADPNSPPAATLMYNYLLAFPDHPDLMPAILTFQRTSIKSARKFNTKIKTVRTPIFGSIYEFSSFQDKNAAGQQFFNIAVKGAGLVEEESLYNEYKAMHQQFTTSGLNIKDIEGLQDEGGSASDNATDEPGGDGRPNY